MVFSDEDKILIKNLYTLKGYNARQLRTEFQDKGWKVASTGCSRSSETQAQWSRLDRSQGSGRPCRARTDENTNQVNNMVLSQEDQPQTHSTVREISRGQAFICLHHKKNLQLKYFKRRHVQELTEANYATHIFQKKMTMLSKSL